MDEEQFRELVDLEVAPDGTSAYAIAAGPLGTCQVSVTADADLGEGVVTITGVLDLEVVGSQATSFVITPGAPEPK